MALATRASTTVKKAQAPVLSTALQGVLKLEFVEPEIEAAYQDELLDQGVNTRWRQVMILSGMSLLSCLPLGWGSEEWQWAARGATVALSALFMAYGLFLRSYPFLDGTLHGWLMLFGYMYAALVLSLTSDRWAKLVGYEGCFSAPIAEFVAAQDLEAAGCDVAGLMEAQCILKLGGLLILSAFFSRLEAWLCLVLLNFVVPAYVVLAWLLGSFEHELLAGGLEDSWLCSRMLNHTLLAVALYGLGALATASRLDLELKNRGTFASEYLKVVQREWETQEEYKAMQKKTYMEHRLQALMTPTSELDDHISHRTSEDSSSRFCGDVSASASCRSTNKVMHNLSKSPSNDHCAAPDQEAFGWRSKHPLLQRNRKSKDSGSTEDSAAPVKTVPLPPCQESKDGKTTEAKPGEKPRAGPSPSRLVVVGRQRSVEAVMNHLAEQHTVKPPNTKLVNAMLGRQADYARIRQMALQIRQKDYTLGAFFEDCCASLPELYLFGPGGDAGEIGRMTASGRSAEVEYQRTIGALFAVYWLLRLQIDGKEAFCYGVDNDWNVRKPRPRRVSGGQFHGAPTEATRRQSVVSKHFARAATLDLRKSEARPGTEIRRSPTGNSKFRMTQSGFGSGDTEVSSTKSTRTSRRSMASVAPDPAQPTVKKLFSQMTPDEKRDSFFKTTNWWEFANLVSQAGCGEHQEDSVECIMAMICLSAFHDIMKMEDLLPVVQPEHSPYCGYKAGVQIQDHDTALAYVLEHFPELLPSFRCLPPTAKELIIFSQGKMHFNHGWFVQAEAPPGIMLSDFKAVLSAGASPRHLGFYFLHWITDLAGAEATPLGGAEKFVLKFPHDVLASFMWSMPFVTKLVHQSETEVFESYLRERWTQLDKDAFHPSGKGAIACLRLAVMVQEVSSTLHAFDELGSTEQSYLADELARTGIPGQFYSESATRGGPAFLVYYGPALIHQHCHSDEDLVMAMTVLGRVLIAARKLWPLKPDAETRTVTIQVGELKSKSLEEIVACPASEAREVWLLQKQNDSEGTVMLRQAADLNCLFAQGEELVILDFSQRPQSLPTPTPHLRPAHSADWARPPGNKTVHEAPPKLEPSLAREGSGKKLSEESEGLGAVGEEEEECASTPTTAQSQLSHPMGPDKSNKAGQPTPPAGQVASVKSHTYEFMPCVPDVQKEVKEESDEQEEREVEKRPSLQVVVADNELS